jgi:hemolysin activation/secretion protein
MTKRFLPFLLMLVGASLPAAAQTPGQTSGNPRFLLESIVVEGAGRDAVRDIVTAESLLQSGREYSEQEIREAVYRIKRLPFVLDADFSLRKGGERGSYQLVITVEETRRFFYSADLGGVYDGEQRHIRPGEDRIDWGGGSTVGGRWFMGSQGLLFGSIQGFDSVGPVAAQVGYTRYNLFGRGGFATVALANDISDESSGENYQGSFALGMPIAGNHSLRADLNWYRSKDKFANQSYQSDSRLLQLSWIYDTTDDPLFPTSGTRLSASAGYSEFEQKADNIFATERSKSEGHDFGISGRRHWALTNRQSVSAELSGSWGEAESLFAEETSRQWSTGATLGHSMDLWGVEKTERIGDLRWETSLDVTSSHDDYPSFLRSSRIDGRLTTGLAFRNAWGLLRLTFSYIDNLQRDEEFRSPF